MEEGNLELMFNADDVNEALNAAVSEGLLCGTCVRKLETREKMSQSDFCPACQEVIDSYLWVLVERRMRELLDGMGLPPDSLQIITN